MRQRETGTDASLRRLPPHHGRRGRRGQQEGRCRASTTRRRDDGTAALPCQFLVGVLLLLTTMTLIDYVSARGQWGSCSRSWPSPRILGAFVGTDRETPPSFDLPIRWKGEFDDEPQSESTATRRRRLPLGLTTARASALEETFRDLRGGASAAATDDDDDDEEEEEEEESEEQDNDADEVNEEGGDQSEYDDESENDDEEDVPVASEAVEKEEESALSARAKRKDKKSKASEGADAVAVATYDEPLVASPFLNLYVSIGVMFLAKKVDLFSPTMVRIARFAFVAYLAVLQAFVLYVRIQAKLANDRTVITLTNPLSSVLQSQLLGGGDSSSGGGAAGGMMKSLASSFLSSTSTVMEYDLKQANSMQSGLLFNMALNWFLHFKMEQVQPLLIQAVTGLLNMVYSPLFQVYVMGRNLERPFPNPNLKKPPASEASDESSPPEADAQEPSPSAIESEKEEEDADEEEDEERDDEDADEGLVNEEHDSDEDAASIVNDRDVATSDGEAKPAEGVESAVKDAGASEPTIDENDSDDDRTSDGS